MSPDASRNASLSETEFMVWELQSEDTLAKMRQLSEWYIDEVMASRVRRFKFTGYTDLSDDETYHRLVKQIKELEAMGSEIANNSQDEEVQRLKNNVHLQVSKKTLELKEWRSLLVTNSARIRKTHPDLLKKLHEKRWKFLHRTDLKDRIAKLVVYMNKPSHMEACSTGPRRQLTLVSEKYVGIEKAKIERILEAVVEELDVLMDNSKAKREALNDENKELIRMFRRRLEADIDFWFKDVDTLHHQHRRPVASEERSKGGYKGQVPS